jgi:hypothetical protein
VASVLAFRARLRLVDARDGGWARAVARRSVCSCDVGRTHRGQPVFLDARLTLEGEGTLAPGEEGVFLVEPLHADLWDAVEAGQAMSVHQGFAARARGTVLERFLRGEVV